nr:hypothetical protein [uncultured Draconibacterium sp.]
MLGDKKLLRQQFNGKIFKVRLNPFHYYIVGSTNDTFIHIFGNIMEGRTNEQKRNLSVKNIAELKNCFRMFR